MSFRHLDNIDEKIIEATIQIGSSNGANRLSTKEIAKACDISEFVIYDHFKSKDNLVSIADHKVFEESAAYAEDLILNRHMKFEEFWNNMVDFFIQRPNYTGWSINYGHIFPRPQETADTDDFRIDITVEAKKCLSHTSIKDDWEFCFVWMLLFRSVVCFAQLLINKELDDTPEIRHLSCGSSLNGIVGLGDLN